LANLIIKILGNSLFEKTLTTVMRFSI